jgi:hypothetical protein
MGGSRVTFSAGLVAADLWAFGEDDLAAAALRLSTEQLREAWVHAARYTDRDHPLPVEGRQVTLGHVSAFAVMTVLEGGVRPLARNRRRPKSAMPPEIAAAKAAVPWPDIADLQRFPGR